MCCGWPCAVVYGQKQNALSIHVEEKLLSKMMSTRFTNSVVMVDVGGKPVRTLPKAVDFHPVMKLSDPRRFPQDLRAHQGACPCLPCGSTTRTPRQAEARRRAQRRQPRARVGLRCGEHPERDSTCRSRAWRSFIDISQVKLPGRNQPGQPGRGLYRRHHRRSVGDEGGRGRRLRQPTRLTVEGEEGESEAAAQRPRRDSSLRASSWGGEPCSEDCMVEGS